MLQLGNLAMKGMMVQGKANADFDEDSMVRSCSLSLDIA